MARAEAAGPSMAKRLPLSRLGLPLRTGIPGHARLLAHPAYQKLLAAEPILRRLIPVLIVIFLAIVGLARLLELYEQKIDRENDAPPGRGAHRRRRVRRPRPRRRPHRPAHADPRPGARRACRRAARWRHRRRPPDLPHRRLRHDPRLRPARRRRRGPPAERDHRRRPAAHHLRRPGRRARDRARRRHAGAGRARPTSIRRSGALAVVEPTAAVYSEWRSNVSLDATIFIGTSAILLVILYGYFAQVRRASEADGIYSRHRGALGDRAECAAAAACGIGISPAAASSGRARCSSCSGWSRATRCSATARLAGSSTRTTAT